MICRGSSYQSGEGGGGGYLQKDLKSELGRKDFE